MARLKPWSQWPVCLGAAGLAFPGYPGMGGLRGAAAPETGRVYRGPTRGGLSDPLAHPGGPKGHRGGDSFSPLAGPPPSAFHHRLPGRARLLPSFHTLAGDSAPPLFLPRRIKLPSCTGAPHWWRRRRLSTSIEKGFGDGRNDQDPGRPENLGRRTWRDGPGSPKMPREVLPPVARRAAKGRSRQEEHLRRVRGLGDLLWRPPLCPRGFPRGGKASLGNPEGKVSHLRRPGPG